MQLKPLPIEDILSDAIDIADSDARRRFLDGACGGDNTLRHKVERLIENHFRAGSFLETPAVVPAAGNTTAHVEGPSGVIGPYRLLEQIGEGGFGIVFMAEQQHPVRRKVALKIIKPGMDTRQVIARFEAERQALALMDHPNIAKVLDAGATESGRPYFVMELIKGAAITDYCDQNRLPPCERLRLFVSVCQAVQHAHQKGIIHRDIKPTNVLIALHDGIQVVKVIDFGIAKATGQQLTERTLFTNFAQMVGTPMYMSPEQATLGGLDIDTRCDVDALGVLLYELLTGTTPLEKERLKQAGYDEMRRLIREEEPPRPSTRLSTLGQAEGTVSAQRQCPWKQLCVLVRGELDWIVMKALEKDRNRRYESASALAADVERHLKDEPVQACPPSRRYLFGKFLRRHRASISTLVSLLLATLLGVAGAAWAVFERVNRQAERERQRHDIERAVGEDLEEATSREQKKEWSRARSRLTGQLCGRAWFPWKRCRNKSSGTGCWTANGGRLRDCSSKTFGGERISKSIAVPKLSTSMGMCSMFSRSSRKHMWFISGRSCSRPEFHGSHHQLSNVLFLQKKPDEAAEESRTAILLNPSYANAYGTLGVILRAQGDATAADEATRKAKVLNEGIVEANSGYLLMGQGRFLEACRAFRRGRELGVPDFEESCASRWLELDERLAETVRDDPKLSGDSERIEFAHLCQLPCRQLYAAAARFYSQAFASDLELVGQRRAGIRYRAARAAAQAGCGQGKDAAHLSEQERARLREQALAWLQADLTGWQVELKDDPKAAQNGVLYEIRRWRSDSGLSCVRDEEMSAKLPEIERDEWQQLWRAVDSFERRATQIGQGGR